MCTLPSDPFVEPFYSLKKASMRLLSPIPESADGTIINIAGRSSAPLTLITPSSTIRAADIAMPVTSKILSNLPAPKWTLIAHCKSNLQVIRLKSLEKECLNTCNKFYLLPLVCINHRLLLFIIGDPDIDFLSSHLPTSPPIALVLNVGMDTKTTFACEILNLFAIWSWHWPSSIPISQLIRLKSLCKELLISCNSLLLSWLVHACSKFLYSISDALYRFSKFWLAYLYTHSFCSECRSDACWLVL